MVGGLIQSGGRRLALDDLRERSLRVASGLTSVGVKDGGIVAILLRNDIPFIESLLAASSIGAYSVPINWHYKTDEVNYILTDSQATHLVVHSDLLRGIGEGIPKSVTVLCVPTPPEVCEVYGIPPDRAAPVEGYPEWEAWMKQYPPSPERPRPPRGSMIYTSGTTGLPKGVKKEPVSSENREAYADLRAQWFGHRPGMRTAMIGPMYHSVQATYAIAAVRANGSVFLLPRFDAEDVLRLVDSQKLTHLHLVPTMMNRLLHLPNAVRQKYDLSSLEFVIHGAAPCPPETKRQMIEWWGPIIYEYYGTTEAGMVCRSSSEEWLLREGTVGKAWSGRTVRIYDQSGNRLPPNTEGEVYMNLGIVPNFTYHNAEHKRAEVERDGLVTNGDIGYLDEEGYLFLCDRKHDLVISGGVNIYPTEVEAVLSTHPAVLDCAVFGIPDDEFGEVPAAALQLRDRQVLSVPDLSVFLGARLAKFKIPRRFDIRDSLPRDESGKIFKRVLRAPYWADARRRF